MADFNGRVSSVYCGSASDGAGLRCVVFMSGCNMRCPYCHNPETWETAGESYTPQGITQKLLRYKNYFRGGGVTFSGGEPFIQEEFCAEAALLLRANGIHTAVETNGSLSGDKLISAADCFICDIKNQWGKIPGALSDFAQKCIGAKKGLSFTNVIIKGVNDDIFSLKQIKDFLSALGMEKRLTFLPFKKLCIEKYLQAGIPFPYADREETDDAYIQKINRVYLGL